MRNQDNITDSFNIAPKDDAGSFLSPEVSSSKLPSLCSLCVWSRKRGVSLVFPIQSEQNILSTYIPYLTGAKPNFATAIENAAIIQPPKLPIILRCIVLKEPVCTEAQPTQGSSLGTGSVLNSCCWPRSSSPSQGSHSASCQKKPHRIGGFKTP